MPEPHDVLHEGLELDDDPRFQRRFWKIERLAWAVFVAILLAAVLGYTGSGGLFARATVASGQAEVDYPRVARRATPDRIEITAPAGQPIVVDLGPAFLDLFDIQAYTPPPARSMVHRDGIRLEFAASGEAGAQDAGRIIIEVEPTGSAIGATAELTVGDGAPAQLGITILP